MEEIILKERELRTKIAYEINESNLPAFIIKPILQDVLGQITEIENKQYEEAKNAVQEKLKKEKEGK